ncbi:hypothetical protein TNCV_152341 [Trichonephila clavipes]|nr:hypothetical protein TNCV_152341 [Trichonephila clavipes]
MTCWTGPMTYLVRGPPHSNLGDDSQCTFGEGDHLPSWKRFTVMHLDEKGRFTGSNLGVDPKKEEGTAPYFRS